MEKEVSRKNEVYAGAACKSVSRKSTGSEGDMNDEPQKTTSRKGASQKRATRKVHMAVDAVMALLLLLVVALPGTNAEPHEWVGIAALVIMLAHFALNVRRAVCMACSRSLAAVVFLAVDVALLVCLVALVVSSPIISDYAFSWLPVLPGMSWARLAHLAASYWMFVLAFVHCGLHLREIAGKLSRKPAAVWAARVVFLACLPLGVYWFSQMGIGSYLTLSAHFAFIDPTVPWYVKVIQFAAIAIAVTGAAHYIAAIVRLLAGKLRKR